MFDFDGVIADSLGTVLSVHQDLLPGLKPEKYLKALEGNINDWDWKKDLDPDADFKDVNFFDHYIPRMKREVVIFKGMDRVVQSLSENYNLVIISSSLSEIIAEFLEKNKIRDCFLKIMGSDIDPSKVKKIKMVFREYNIGPDQCVFITDTLGDAREANQVQVGVIGVGWGFHSKEILAQETCFRMVDRPEEIRSAVSDYFALDFIK